jgi:hypothetical protein
MTAGKRAAAQELQPRVDEITDAIFTFNARANMKQHWHEHNPWADSVVYVPIERLAECVAGGTIAVSGGGSEPYDVARVLQHFQQVGRDKLDAYILPQPDGVHSLGVRYGAESSEYYSPHNAHPELTQALLEEFSPDK